MLRARLCLPAWSSSWPHARTHLSTALNALHAPSPASLEVEAMPFPTARPDPSVFEPMSDEYTSVSAPGSSQFTPLSSSDTLASLVLAGKFGAAASLREELESHNIPIPHSSLYYCAALYVLSLKAPEKKRLDAFEAWLSLVPDRNKEWLLFRRIRWKLFSSDPLNLLFVYRFGLILASKGYYKGDAAAQALSTIARYAQPSVVERYLREMEDRSRDYLGRSNKVLPPGFLPYAYNLAIRTLALAGKGEAAFHLMSIARSRGMRISDFTLDIATHTPDRQAATEKIRVRRPCSAWQQQDTSTYPVPANSKPVCTGSTDDIAALATRLRSLRTAIRSSSPPSPHALLNFIASYHSLGRTRAPILLRSLAHRYSTRSLATWALAEMLYYRSRCDPRHVLLVFSLYFHLVGVPRQTLPLIKGMRKQQAQKGRAGQLVAPFHTTSRKLWPSAYHTALVWESLVSLSPEAGKQRLYALLLSRVRRSRQSKPGSEQDAQQVVPEPEPDRPRVQLAPVMYDAAHFSPFVAWRARSDPAWAARVLQDMRDLGIEPSVIQWSIVARSYARQDNPFALDILDHLEGIFGRDSEDGGASSDVLLGVYANVLRGFVMAGSVERAREVEKRFAERFAYQVGHSPATGELADDL